MGKHAVLGLDLAGRSLHKRGYRIREAEAPIRENVAAAILMRAGWPGAWRNEECMTLVDPMCGSGTFLAEAWMMAADMAPGVLRQDYAITRAPWHPRHEWDAALDACRTRYESGREWALKHVRLWGSDVDAAAIQAARANLAVLDDAVPATLIRADACKLSPDDLALTSPGLMVTNPPYGERLGDEQRLRPVYRAWGQQLKACWGGWTLMMITSSQTLAQAMPLAADKTWKMKNGGLDCILARYGIRAAETTGQAEPGGPAPAPSAFANRLAKNWKKRQRWARRENIKAFRVYDADMPEYAVAVDWYDGWVHVQEYAPPPTIREDKARRRLYQVLDDVAAVLDVPPEHVFLKQRKPQKGTTQYTRQAELRYEKVVEEGAARLWVNLSDFLDTGLFLDHRPTRLWIADHARGKRFLNLFCYTGAATVHAALGGAARTVSVDLSNTYLDWARRNLTENGLAGGKHALVRADVLSWLKSCRETFDLIFMDPPTFSNSKKMRDVLDIQRDHAVLVHAAMSCLTTEGLLIFSTNYRRFKLDPALEADYLTEEVSDWSVPPDFERNRRIHRCWHIRHR
ncbi:bifunctional 23S rRNA (guanine(2069)-N(7))-methyltransferase RlmK/23S rRNA (guanine(2445)-N(2))-methyltransferase RlmL [Hahella sp. SMD15-11]|uniref:Bifunctional 23S rRNA (Guanine(2069)-N(7))-methyltransferase RlmK/23S rRNA (Guanine(2445)-N(2))-methyltransferase RlmL n=1 Tax=Thermohahella caldifontis TaxID=3142973 RepID=A0AB39V106_9GAMM